MKPIQLLNIESALKRMNDAKNKRNEDLFKNAQSELSLTLSAIKNADQKTYDKYYHFLKDKF